MDEISSYYINEFKNREDYINFIKYFVHNSDAFSLVYFRYTKNERVKESVKKIKKLLQPYKIYSKTSNEWPGTKTLNYNNHIYTLCLYRSDERVIDILSIVNDIFDWEYPDYPMDLSFFKNGYAWLTTCSHEYFCILYTNNKSIVTDLKELGVDIEKGETVYTTNIFYDEKAKIET